MRRISRESYYSFLSTQWKKESKTLLIDENGSYSEKESFDILCGIINELHAFGVKRNHVVILSTSSRKETALIIQAIIAIGAVVFLKDPRIELEDFLNDLEVNIKYKTHLYFDDEKWVISKRKHLSLTPQAIQIKPHLKNRKDAPCIYLTTSGSSGKNKIVALSEYTFFNHVIRQHHAAGTTNGCGYLCLPLYHMFGLEMLTIYLTSGNAVYISKSRNPEYAIEIINKYHCTSIPNVPTFYFMLIDALKKNNDSVPSLKYGVIAGGSYSKEQFLEIENKLDMTLLSTYGLTEGCTTLTDTYGIKNATLRSSGVGKPFPGIDVVFKDNNNKINELTGEICFKGYNLMLGYLKENGLYLPIDEDGYFHTGDIGGVDSKGIYHIIGRKKDIIIRGGENLSPSLIEQKMMQLDEIKDVCVAGVKDQKYEEVVGAFIVLSEEISKEELAIKLKPLLSKSELPVRIIISKEIPTLNSGKHDKNKVRELLNEN